MTVTAIGVGGDYFLFHPLQLLSGGYVSDEDYMADRVVLDAQTAFNLFGSSDVAGMEVTINGKTFPIAGVVKSEDDFATAAALDAGAKASSDPTGVQSASKAMIYMSYAALNAMAELPIDCYEIVLPDPVSGFAKKLMTEKIPHRQRRNRPEYRTLFCLQPHFRDGRVRKARHDDERCDLPLLGKRRAHGGKLRGIVPAAGNTAGDHAGSLLDDRAGEIYYRRDPQGLLQGLPRH